MDAPPAPPALGLADYHMHTTLCRHAEGTVEAYAERAIALGLREIAFTEHAPMPPGWGDSWRMREDDLDAYVSWIERARARFPAIKIRLGLEADFVPGTEGYVERILKSRPFDFVIGSVHFLGDWTVDHQGEIHKYRGRDPAEVARRYFDLVSRSAASGLFDSLGHADLIKKFNLLPREGWEELFGPVARAAARHGAAFDVNTAGLRKPAREIYPSAALLRIAAREGAKVTLGSDAHAPGEVGANFAEAAALLRAAGFRAIGVYDRRRREELPLPPGL